MEKRNKPPAARYSVSEEQDAEMELNMKVEHEDAIGLPNDSRNEVDVAFAFVYHEDNFICNIFLYEPYGSKFRLHNLCRASN